MRSFILSEGPLVPILSLALLILAGLALWLFFATRPPGEDSAEAGFARDMMVHHAQAVEMAEIVRGKTESEDVGTLAPDIALTQQAQIGMMQGWLQVWGLLPTGSEPAMSWMGEPTNAPMPGMATPQEIQKLRDASPEEADKLFLRLMIPHHRAALRMSEAILSRTQRPEVRSLAKAISASQQAEIKNVEQMLRDRGASVPEEPEMNMKNM